MEKQQNASNKYFLIFFSYQFDSCANLDIFTGGGAEGGSSEGYLTFPKGDPKTYF